MDLFEEIAEERLGLADTLAGLTEEQLQTDSLCEGWTVHDVSAHILMPLVTPTIKVVAVMARHGMNFDRANISLTRSVAKRSPAQIVSGLRENANSHFTPPGLGPEAPLTDAVVHGQDIRRPLGLTRDIPADRQLVILKFLTGSKSRAFVPASRVAGLRFTATDLDWSLGQDGPEVSGTAEALMMTLAGRGTVATELTGPGATILAERLAAG